ncbi:MAG TPA: asparagine synthase (glutamine-hydrolyzing) [Candidatus Cloacimonetes bacterium]|nr:asparagine synthase (glutamine-hydrolyzing) [Candidatus Cloacimonas sp.]HHZ15663.1 asparagine synthase (glutamine-hydrolyzing) [Candidatus Cloacimonadota bacterium]
MSAISGFICLNNEKRLPAMRLREMSDLGAHRGPDATVFFTWQEATAEASASDTIKGEPIYAGLSYRHLDLGTEHFNPNILQRQGLYLLFDGAIYNAQELRAALSLDADVTDPQLILNAYQMWGDEFVNRLIGIWALVIWDSNTQRLFCSRDRFGSKPLCYLIQDQVFYFASEIKQLLPVLETKEVNAQMLWRMNKVSGMHLYQDQTPFRQIKILEPGQNLSIQRGKIQKEYYYRLNTEMFETSQLSFADAAEYYLELFRESVRLCATEPEEITCALSGGLDSTAILAILSKLKSQPISTFSTWFEDAQLDEREYIELANNSFNAQGTLLSPTAEEAWQSLLDATWYSDLPLGSGCSAQLSVFKAARKQGFKVLIGGQGSDELTAGYRHAQYRYLADLAHGRQFPQFIASLKSISKAKRPVELISIVAKSGLSLLFPESQLYRQEMKHLHFEPFSSDFLESSKDADMDALDMPETSRLSSFSYNMVYNTTLQTLLHFEDRMSAMAGMQSRSPFLDYRLVELAFSLPSSYKLDPPQGKRIHRAAIQDMVPKPILERKDKAIFGTPFTQRWMRNELKDRVYDIFTSSSFRRSGYWNLSKIMSRWQSYLNGNDKDAQMLYQVVATHIWLKTFNII